MSCWKSIMLFVLTSGSVFAEELTFQQAVDQMMRQNPVLAQQNYSSQIAGKQWHATRAGYLPQLDFVQSWSRSDNPVYVFGSLLNQQKFTEKNFAIDSLNQPDPLSDNVSKFQVGWLIYDFGRRESRLGSARSGYRIATLQEQAIVVSFLQQLVRRYYAVSLARQRLEVTEEALKSAQARLEQARARVQQGMVVQSDLLAAEVFVASRMQENIDATHQNLLAIAGLQEILGDTETANVSTADLKEKQFDEYDLAWWRGEMTTNRAELKIVKEGQRMASEEVSAERSDFFPSLQAWSAYEWHGASLSYSGENWGAGVELRWNLFRGFSDALQFSAAKLMQKNAQEKLRETENSLWLELQTAYYRYQSAKEKWKVGVAAVQHASESRRIYAERYASGLVTIQDSLQAETAYKEARLMLSQNIYEMYVAYADLLAAGGKVEELKKL